ncbi:MAG: cytochrome P450 [Pseudonocardia sp.]
MIYESPPDSDVDLGHWSGGGKPAVVRVVVTALWLRSTEHHLMVVFVGERADRGVSECPAVERGQGGRAFLSGETPRGLAGPAWHALTRSAGTRSVEGRPITVVTDYRGATALLGSPLWSRAAAQRDVVGPASAMSVTDMDPPRHTRFRRLIDHAFSARAVERLRPGIARRAFELVDEIRTTGPLADLVTRFCTPFAFGVHCDLLGVPEDARPALLSWSLARSGQPGATPEQIAHAERGLARVVTDVLDRQRRAGNGTGLFPALLRRHRDEELSDDELIGLAASMFFDGHILASAQIAQAVLCLVLHPEQLRRVRDDFTLIPAAAEEILRFSPAITVGMTRVPTAAGASAAGVAFGLVNRDPAVFGHPDGFSIDRCPNRHLSFGRGVHHCLGAALMRQELHVAIEALLRGLPGLRLAQPEHTIAWSASLAVRSLDALMLEW